MKQVDFVKTLFKYRIQSIIFFSFFFIFSYSQSPVIGIDQFYKTNTNYTRKGYSPSVGVAKALVQISGSNKVWDLRPFNLETIYACDTLKMVEIPEEYPYYSDYYDTSNVLIQIKNNFNNYFFNFLKNSDTLYYVGGGAFGTQGEIEAIFQKFMGNFLVELNQNIAYGSSYKQNFEGSWYDGSGSDEHYIKRGLMELTADSYGEVITTNNETIKDVLRISKILTYTDSNYIFGVQQRVDTLITWYAKNYTCPLISLRVGAFYMNYQFFGSSEVTIYDLGIHQQVAINNVIESFNPVFNINPSQIIFEMPEMSYKNISLLIFNIMGSKVYQANLKGGRNIIEREGFNRGLYIAVIVSDNDLLMSRKLWIE